MAKKKVVNRVSPSIVKKQLGVSYSDLDDGDSFIYEGSLYIKMEVYNQEGICLSNDDTFVDNMCGTYVIPVNIKIIWEEKK